MLEGKPANFKKGKWNRILERVHEMTGYSIVTADDAKLLREFKSIYRSAELHKYSIVRAFTERVIGTICKRKKELQRESLNECTLTMCRPDIFVNGDSTGMWSVDHSNQTLYS